MEGNGKGKEAEPGFFTRRMSIRIVTRRCDEDV
jgi:hypothetical protein